MRIKIPLSFPEAKPPRLKDDLERFAKEVYQFTQDADATYEPQATVEKLNGNGAASFGTLLIANTQNSVSVVNCPRAVPGQDNGKSFVLEVVGSGAVVLQPSGVQIDNETAIVVTAGTTRLTVQFDGAQFITGRKPTVRTIEWGSQISATLTVTGSRFIAREFANGIQTAINPLSMRPAGIDGVARQLQVYRFGPTAGINIPTAGFSGVVTGSGQFVYSLVQNGTTVATGLIPTLSAYGAISMVASCSRYDMFSVKVTTPSGTVYGGPSDHEMATLRVEGY